MSIKKVETRTCTVNTAKRTSTFCHSQENENITEKNNQPHISEGKLEASIQLKFISS